jgi:hypothetical protein
MAGYAALKDWDFLCHFAFFHSDNNWDNVKSRRTWNSTFDPTRMGLFPAASLIFLRHDVDAAKKVVQCLESEEPYADVLKNKNIPAYLRMFGGIAPYPRLRPYYAYLSRVENVFAPNPNARADAVISNQMTPAETFDALVKAGINAPDLRQTLRFVSDTGQLTSDVRKGIFTLNTPRTQAAVGFLKEAGRIDLQDIAVDGANTFATVVVSAIDDRPIARSARMLVTVVGDADNTDEKRNVVGNFTEDLVGKLNTDAASGERFRPAGYRDRFQWGRVSGTGPVLVEPVSAKLIFKGSAGDSLKVFALSTKGERTEELEAAKDNAGIMFQVSGTRCKTIYYEVVREK